MVYRAIGLMSGSSLDGLDIVFAEFLENGGNWQFEIRNAACYGYPEEWKEKLEKAITLPAKEYQLLHAAYGHYLGQQVNTFIQEHQLHYQVALIASHGHTTFHLPPKMTAQLGDGAALAAETGLPVVNELRALDVALGGQGAPIVPLGEKLLLGGYPFFLNIGGIANISVNQGNYTAFDVCPANRVLNMLSNERGEAYDKDGAGAAAGTVNEALLERLNGLDYYKQGPPKSLANDFGTDLVYPLIKSADISIPDALCTYTEHIAGQIRNALQPWQQSTPQKLLVTGGGAFNQFLIGRLATHLKELNIEPVVPDENLVKYKEALIMALLGVLRWREENTVISSVTGASYSSCGGALWMGQQS